MMKGNFYFIQFVLALLCLVGSQQATGLSRNGEFLIDTTVVYIPHPSGQYDPDICLGNTTYLAVWEGFQGSMLDIYGARVALDGTILDPAGFRLCIGAHEKASPTAVFGDSNYLVVWTDLRDIRTDIYGTFVHQMGTVTDTIGFPICAFDSFQFDPAVSFDGSNFFVVWQDKRNDLGDIYGARVTQAGVVLDTHGVVISDAPDKQFLPDVAFDRVNYLVVWRDYRSGTENDIYGARITASGVLLDTSGIVVSTAARNQCDPAVVFGDNDYLVAWQDSRIQENAFDVYGSRITPGGAVLDTNGILISSHDHNQGNVALSFDGSEYLVVWNDARVHTDSVDIYCTRVSQSGIVQDPAGIPISTRPFEQTHPAVAFDGVRYCILWYDFSGQGGHYRDDIFGARMESNCTVLDSVGFPVSTCANWQAKPSLGYDGLNYLCVWQDSRDDPDTANIYALRIDENGSVLDTTMIQINTANGRQYFPAVAFDGINYLAIWRDTYNDVHTVRGARISQEGVVLDTQAIEISQVYGPYDFSSVGIGFCEPYYLVAWDDTTEIFGTRIAKDGTVLDTMRIEIGDGNESSYNPFITTDGHHFFIVWESFDYYPWSAWYIWCARIDTLGSAIGSPFRITTNPYDQRAPAACYNASQQHYFIAWQDRRNGTWDIYGSRVDRYGTALDTSGIAICIAVEDQKEPTVSFDGTYYIVTWQDFRNGSDWDIYCAEVDSTGQLVDTYLVSDQVNDQLDPFSVQGDGGQILMTYSGWADSVNQHPANAARVWGRFYPFVGIDEKAAWEHLGSGYKLQVHPNPFCDEVNIRYGTGKTAECIEFAIYDVTGRLVRQWSCPTTRPSNQISWDGTDESSKKLPSGVYFLKFRAGDCEETRKLLLIR